MHLRLPVEKKKYIDLIKCDSDIYKTASRQNIKPWGDILSASTISVIGRNTCLMPLSSATQGTPEVKLRSPEHTTEPS